MASQTLLKYQRDGDTLTLELKRDPPIAAMFLSLFSFAFFGSCLVSNDVALAFVLLVFFLFGVWHVIHSVYATRILRYDANTLHIEKHYKNIFPLVKILHPSADPDEPTPQGNKEPAGKSTKYNLASQFSIFVSRCRPDRWHSFESFDRKEVLPFISRVIYVSKTFDTSTFRMQNNYRYETRLFFGKSWFREYRNKLTILHETREQMDELDAVFTRFVTEVPYKQPLVAEIRPTNEKEYRISRNANFPDRGDGIPPKKKKTYRLTYSENKNNTSRELIVVSERGSGISSIIGRGSRLIFNTIQLLLALALLTLYATVWFYWENIATETLVYLQSEHGQKILRSGFLPNEWVDEIPNAIQNSPVGELWKIKLGGLVVVSIGVLPFILVLDFLLYGILRWPLWSRWVLRIENPNNGEATVFCDWQTDRRHERSGKVDIAPFFKVISASNRTNFAVSGRTFDDSNPAWRRRFQVVVITAKRSFVIPVNDEKEQRKMIRVLEKFDAGSLYNQRKTT